MKIAINVGWLFCEIKSISERMLAVANAGFRFVENPNPYELNEVELSRIQSQTGLQHVQINAPCGATAETKEGFACLKAHQAEYMKSVETAISYADALKCKRIHVKAGLKPAGVSDTELQRTYLDNLSWTLKQCQEKDLTVLIEPLSPHAVSNYFLCSFDQAETFLKTLAHPNLKIQVDLFHLQCIHGSITAWLKRLQPWIGHVQVSQVPERNEPGTPGELDYDYIFQLLRSLGYNDYIGTEYRPKSTTTEGLGWIEKYGLEK